MTAADNSVPIGIGVAGKGYVESLLQTDHGRHRIHGRRIHPNLTVPIDRHKAKSRIDDVVHYLEIESVAIANCVPVSHACASQRIDTNPNLTLADCLKIDDRREIAHIRIEVLMGMNGGSFPRTFKRNSRYSAQAVGKQSNRMLFYRLCDMRVRRSTVGRIVFEAAEFRRVMRWRDNDTIGQPLLAPAI